MTFVLHFLFKTQEFHLVSLALGFWHNQSSKVVINHHLVPLTFDTLFTSNFCIFIAFKRVNFVGSIGPQKMLFNIYDGVESFLIDFYRLCEVFERVGFSNKSLTDIEKLSWPKSVCDDKKQLLILFHFKIFFLNY